MSHGLCTLSHVSYATQPRYCRNYALKIYDTRRKRRNAPSMARFSLPCHPWQGISVYRVHNSTVSKRLRYSLMRESVPSRSHGIKPLTLWPLRCGKKYNDKVTQLCYNLFKETIYERDKLIPVITITVYLGTKGDNRLYRIQNLNQAAFRGITECL